MSHQSNRIISAGLYGFKVHGLDSARESLVKAPDEWPVLHVERRLTNRNNYETVIEDDRACIALEEGGRVLLDRGSMRATFETARPLPDETLVHPYFVPAASVFARWMGREGIHAGAFVTGGSAWIVCGDRMAGKSTLLAMLALAQVDVLTDDLVVIDDNIAYAGPRCLDLRTEALTHLRDLEPTRVVRNRERNRLQLPQVEAEVPLQGWIYLEWGPYMLGELAPTDRLARMSKIGLGDHRRGIEIVTLPALLLRRPRDWSGTAEIIKALSALGAH